MQVENVAAEPSGRARYARLTLGGNKGFEEAVIKARSESSKWVEVLVEGKLGINNALKLADAKKANALLFSVI